MDLELVAVDLYGLAPDSFTAARNQAAAQAKAAGEITASAAIKALRKPTLAAWLANQLVRAEPDRVDELTRLGSELREAHLTRDGARLRELTPRRHELVAELVTAATRRAAEQGRKVTEAVADRLTETLDAALVDPTAAQLLRSGRLTSALRHVGFGVVDESGTPAHLTSLTIRPNTPTTAATPTPAATSKARAAGSAGRRGSSAGRAEYGVRPTAKRAADPADRPTPIGGAGRLTARNARIAATARTTSERQKAERNTAEQRAAERRAEREAAERRIAERNRRELEARLAELDSEYAEAETERAAAEAEVDANEHHIADMQTAIERLTEELDNARRELKRAQSQTRRLERTLTRTTRMAAIAERRRNAATARLASLG
ncbi:hypothetical protein [Kribbella deserti]|uniref:Transposase n=1 Tax=Kribbella deserti TaxID=1926257 RepID=A0ABV6QHF9_9ACTN